MTATKLTRKEVLRIVSEARAEGKRPDLSNANLTSTNLGYASLHDANLPLANLSGANLTDAGLADADLSGADLSNADLTDANLTDADLRDANLRGAWWGGLATDGLHRYRCLLTPTPDGWVTRIGCWAGTIPELRELIEGGDWPESGEKVQERLRPLLRLWCDLADAHTNSRPHVIPDLTKRWGES